jgi:hypothetical protein
MYLKTMTEVNAKVNEDDRRTFHQIDRKKL